ncbi:helix-turn-helix domain-containing protein [Thermogladius sp. 4427co]|uniref:helix-turn-helix domain-containing protein n=1 Tax=Thermogladius sp. 4427co TaxID=3450718 RepID=UPI003F791878
MSGENKIERAIELYRQGVPIKKIVEEIHISTKTLYKALKERGEKLRKSPPRRLTPEEIEKIKKLYLEKYSIYRIAKELGLRPSRVYNVLKKLSIK